MGEADEQPLAAMTVNERLFHVGILDQWDAAVRRRDRQELISLLERVEVGNPDRTVDALLANPKKYGY